MTVNGVTSFMSGTRLYTAGIAKHEFELEVYKTRWPPFYSTAFFLPTVSIRIENRGENIANCWIEVQIMRFDGDVMSISTLQGPWWSAGIEGQLEVRDWVPGSEKSYVARIPGRALPGPGTYIVRVMVMNRILDENQSTAYQKSYRIEQLLDQRILDYFRIEEFSNVLNFGIVVAAFLAVIVALLPNLSASLLLIWRWITTAH
jgi:hypothetical protein